MLGKNIYSDYLGERLYTIQYSDKNGITTLFSSMMLIGERNNLQDKDVGELIFANDNEPVATQIIVQYTSKSNVIFSTNYYGLTLYPNYGKDKSFIEIATNLPPKNWTPSCQTLKKLQSRWGIAD